MLHLVYYSPPIVTYFGLSLSLARLDVEQDRKLAIETTALVETYTFPDGRKVNVAEERFEAPQVLFYPHLIGIESVSISEAIFDTIQNADIDLRPELYKNIILCGGSSLFPGFHARLTQELEALYLKKILKGNKEARAQSRIKINVIASKNRLLLVFSGAKYLGQIMKDKSEFWITKVSSPC